MNINRNNCEAWFLDFYEGNLPEGQVQELFAFLILNPDLRDAFDSYEAVSFDPDQLVNFDAKEGLKKPVTASAGISETNYEEYIVGAVEGTLSAEEEKQLEIFLAAHPAKREELELLRKTILEPEAEIVFENKASLKKTVLVTAENFEAFAVEFLDGMLSGETLAQFEDFVAAHPEKQKELALFGQTKLQPDTAVVFEDKASLKRKALLVSEENFEELAVASLEGQLNTADENTFAAFVAAHPEKQKAVALYAQTKLQADTAIVFEDKESLRRKKRGAFYWMSDVRFAAAAAVALLIGIFWWTGSGVDPVKNDGARVANRDSAKTKNTFRTDESDSYILPNDEKNLQLADAGSAPKHNRTNTFVNTVQKQHSKNNEELVSLSSNGNLQLRSASGKSDLDFSEALYSGTMGNTPQQDETVSATQFAMRWMKDKLDQRKDEDGDLLPESPIRGGSEEQNVSGFDLTSSAINRIGHSTGGKLHLGKSDAGTVLTFGKYDILLMRNR